MSSSSTAPPPHTLVDAEIDTNLNIERSLSSKALFALLVSLFAVLSHWGFWDIGVYALDWNTTVTYLCLIFL